VATAGESGSGASPDSRRIALESLVVAVAIVAAHAPFDPNCRGGIPVGFWRDLNNALDALQRVQETM